MSLALGITHRRFNFLLSPVYLFIVGLFTYFDWEALGCFGIGYLLGTTILTPDVDLGPNRFAGLSKLFLYPYSLIFKHRGVSHSIFLGTLTRVLYALLISWIVLYIGSLLFTREQMGLAPLAYIKQFILDYNYRVWWHKWLTWLYIGLFMADLSHIFIDSCSSWLKKNLFKS